MTAFEIALVVAVAALIVATGALTVAVSNLIRAQKAQLRVNAALMEHNDLQQKINTEHHSSHEAFSRHLAALDRMAS
jgi:hypothetical protein